MEKPFEKLLWIDLEMTGLDVQQERIIEAAVIITDRDLQPLAEYSSAVFQPQSLIDRMDEWNTNQHTQSGLVEKVKTAPKEKDVEQHICALVSEHFNEPALLAGNSIGQDRKFIDAYWPGLSQLLHYRMLDVTAWKIIMNSRYNVSYDKKDTHRALSDIQESIHELQTFLNFIEKK